MIWRFSRSIGFWCGPPTGLLRRIGERKALDAERFWGGCAGAIRVALAIPVIVAWWMWAADAAVAAFPGHNGLIAFDTGDGPRSQIYTVRPDGKRLRQLTHGARGQRMDPHWSADGARIAYVSNESGTPQIWVMSSSGRHQHRVTHDPDADYFSPSWSPDGKRILTSRCSHLFGTCDIVTITAEGRGLRMLVGGYWHHGQPAYSPDGTRIAYTSDQGGYDSLLWIADADGRHRRHITPPWVVADRGTWSPDGSHLTFTGNPEIAEIFSVASAGGRIRRLEPPESLYASYSPDGHKLVFVGTDRRCGCRALFTAQASGRHAHALASIRLDGLRLSDWGVAR